ncbi:RNA-directed DNA polymerase, eukaryota, reverse transcriptase zinc-binding domain protein [Tanacetum coccineum]
MTRLENFRLKSMWGNYNFDFAYSMARGRSGGLISVWDPNSFIKDDTWFDDIFIIVKWHWRNTIGDCYMINIYGPQVSLAKAILWNRIGDFMHQHADNFNSFIDNSGLIDLPLGSRRFTWMNKAGTKLSKLDRFLISE